MDHDAIDDPVVIYEELGPGRLEHRKVRELRNGRLERTHRVALDLETGLSPEPIPDETVINGLRPFTIRPISAEEFEAVWRRATDAG